MHPEWWHWAVGGITLILAELVVPAFVLIWFGLGALGVALAAFLLTEIDVTLQLSIWLVASIGLTVLWFKVFKPGQLKTRIGSSSDNPVGEIGLLARDVGPFLRGEVRLQKPILGADVWPCISDEPLSSGSRVRVIAVEGSLLKVARI